MPSASSEGNFRSQRVSWNRGFSNQPLAFALAVLLPPLASILIARSPILQTIPFSLYFISIGIVVNLGGMAPALLTVILCAVTRRLLVAPYEPLLAFNAACLYRLSVLIGCAALFSLLDRRRHISALRLATAMRDLQERNQAFVESLHAGKCASWVYDLSSGGSPRWFRGSYQVFGRPFEEVEQLGTPAPLLHPDDQARFPDLIHLMRTASDPILWDHRCVWPNGETHWLEIRATRDPGETILWRGLTADITERKLTESALVRSEKLAAMGRLASTVAHEINNPLESVTNLLYLANSDLALSQETRTYLRTAELELARLGDITRLTLGFVRTSAGPREIVLAVVVEEVLSIFRHRLESRGIHVVRDFDSGVQLVMAPHELRQILTNLISNASDALQGVGSCLAIRIFGDAGSACFTLEDNGSGIPPEALPRIFDPFFTTKPDVGTGIGLWVTRELVESNRGRITVESGELTGGMKTRFRVEFTERKELVPYS